MCSNKQLLKWSIEESLSLLITHKQVQASSISLLALDGNLLIETEESVMFLPLKINPRISDALFDIGVLKIEITPCLEGLSLKAIENFFLALQASHDDLYNVFFTIKEPEWGVRLMFLSPQSVPNQLKEISRTWYQNCLNQFEKNQAIVISLHQPGYLRHLGFFIKLAQSDILGVEDNLQYCKQEWQNRQRFQDTNGSYHWMTVPLKHTGSYESISSKFIARDIRWRDAHWHRFEQRFAGYPYYQQIAPFFQELYKREWYKLRSLSEAITRYTAIAMGLKHSNFIRTSALSIKPGKKGYAIVEFIKKILPPEFQPASSSKRIVYLAGIDSSYLEEIDTNGIPYSQVIRSAGIDIRYQQANEYYSIQEKGFSHGTPAIEILFKEGVAGTRLLMQSVTKSVL